MPERIKSRLHRRKKVDEEDGTVSSTTTAVASNGTSAELSTPVENGTTTAASHDEEDEEEVPQMNMVSTVVSTGDTRLRDSPSALLTTDRHGSRRSTGRRDSRVAGLVDQRLGRGSSLFVGRMGRPDPPSYCQSYLFHPQQWLIFRSVMPPNTLPPSPFRSKTRSTCLFLLPWDRLSRSHSLSFPSSSCWRGPSASP